MQLRSPLWRILRRWASAVLEFRSAGRWSHRGRWSTLRLVASLAMPPILLAYRSIMYLTTRQNLYHLWLGVSRLRFAKGVKATKALSQRLAILLLHGLEDTPRSC